jgi:hypothetical protein
MLKLFLFGTEKPLAMITHGTNPITVIQIDVFFDNGIILRP